MYPEPYSCYIRKKSPLLGPVWQGKNIGKVWNCDGTADERGWNWMEIWNRGKVELELIYAVKPFSFWTLAPSYSNPLFHKGDGIE